jgi:hypothetical protein
MLKQEGYSEKAIREVWKWYANRSSSVEISKPYIGLTPKVRWGLKWIYGISLK